MSRHNFTRLDLCIVKYVSSRHFSEEILHSRSRIFPERYLQLLVAETNLCSIVGNFFVGDRLTIIGKECIQNLIKVDGTLLRGETLKFCQRLRNIKIQMLSR